MQIAFVYGVRKFDATGDGKQGASWIASTSMGSGEGLGISGLM